MFRRCIASRRGPAPPLDWAFGDSRFYFVVRGGFLLFSGELDLQNINPFGIAALAGLSGMFSKQAADKLGEVFDDLFKTEKGTGDDERADKLEDLERPISEVMLKRNFITTYKIEAGKTEKDIKINELCKLLGGNVTRILVLDEQDKLKYIIHDSMLYKFIAEKSLQTALVPVNISMLTLDDFLNFSGMRYLVEKAVAFVPVDATLEDAEREMEHTPNCQDVIVTDHGKPNEPLIGWLTNTEISKHCRV